MFRPAFVDFGGALGARLAQTILALVTSVYLARALGPSGRGVLAIVVVTATQAVNLFSLGVDTATVHFAGRQHSTPESLSRATLLAALVLGLPGLLCGLLLLQFVFIDDLPGDVRRGSYLVVATIPLSLIIMYWQAILRSTGRILESSGLTVLDSILILLAAVVAVEAGWGVEGVVTSYALVEIAMVTSTAALCAHLRLAPRKRHLDWSLVRRLTAYGAKGHVGTILQGLNYRLDLFVVAIFLQPADVGIYAVVVGVGEFLWLIPNVLGILLLQRAAGSSDTHATATTIFATRVVAAVTGALSLAWLFAAEPMLRLVYGTRFDNGATALRILLLGIWALAIWKNLANDLGGRGLPQYKSYTALLGVIVTIALDLFLIPRYGIEGAAIATSAAYCLTALTMIFFYTRATGASPRSLLIMERGDARRLAQSVQRSLRRRRPASVADSVGPP